MANLCLKVRLEAEAGIAYASVKKAFLYIPFQTEIFSLPGRLSHHLPELFAGRRRAAQASFQKSL